MNGNKNLAAAMCSVKMEGFTFDSESEKRFAKLGRKEITVESHIQELNKKYNGFRSVVSIANRSKK